MNKKIKEQTKENKNPTKENKNPTKGSKKIIQKKDNSKKELEKLKKEINLLKKQNVDLELLNQKNIIEFQLLAKNFQNKAQKQVNEKQKEISEKLEKEKEHIKKYGSQKLLESILEPIINIEMAINAGKKNESVKSYVIGFEMLLNQIYQEIESFGVKKIEPKIGDDFDPGLHQILNFSKEKGKKNTVSKLIKRGFKLNDRVIKVAIIEVYK